MNDHAAYDATAYDVAAVKSETIPHPTPGDQQRVMALVGFAGVFTIIQRVADAAGILQRSLSGRVLARLDIATPLMITAAAYLLARRLFNVDRPFRRLVRLLVILALLWWITLGVSFAALHPGGRPKQLLATVFMFRNPRDARPLLGSSIGVVILVIALTALLASAIMPIVRTLTRRYGKSSQTCLGITLGTLFVGGWLVRLAALGVGRTSVYGVLSHLPGVLDMVAVGFGVATSAALVKRLPNTVVVLGAGAAAAGTLLLNPQVALPAHQVLIRAALQMLCAGLVVLWVVRTPTPTWARRLVLGIAMAAPGFVLFGETAVVVVARQYRERVSEDASGLHLIGPTVPTVLWSICIAAAFGVALCAGVAQPARRLLLGSWPQAWYKLTLAGVVATGFLWRVAALLTIAPERTDGGDPLFYHTTANMLAQGKGFSEPLNWIAYGKEIPSAVHGPLYPVVLSLSSRLGGTTYFDHKMLSCIIGAALVLVVGLVATHLAGPGAGVIAAVFAAAYPNLWIIDGVLFPEGLTALLTTSALLVGYRWRQRPRLATAIAIGVLLGLAVLTRGEAISLLVLFVAPFLLLHRELDVRTRVRHVIAAGLACTVVLVPWTVRNLSVFNEFVPLSTNSNDLLTYANCDETYSGKFLGFWLYDCQEQIRREVGEPPGDESEKAVFWRKNGLNYLTDHLSELPKVVAARIGRQWELFRPIQNTEFAPIEGRNRTAAEWGLAMYYGLALASVSGAVQLRRRRMSGLPLYAVLLNVTATAALAYGTTRFRAPAEPVLCILAAVGCVPVVAWMRRRCAPLSEAPISDDRAFVLGGSTPLQSARRNIGNRFADLGWRTPICLAALAAAITLPLRGLYRATGSTMEEGFMLTFPERVLAGDIPNVDFLHLYGPGSLDALAGWYRIFGATMTAERTFGLLQQLGIVLGIWVVARAWGRLAATLCACFSAIFVFTPIGLQALAWSGAVALGLWSVIAAMRARSARSGPQLQRLVVLSGVLAGLALTFRPDLGLALGLAHIFILWRSRRWHPFVVGLTLGLLPLWVHLVRAGPAAAFRGMILDPVFSLRAGRELPRPPSWNHMDGALQVIGEKFPPWWGLPSLPASQQLAVWFFMLPLVAFALLAVALAARRTSSGSPRTVLLVAVSLFGVGLLPQALQRPDSAHFLWVACISWPLAPLGLIELWYMRTRRTHPTIRTSLSVLTIAALTLVVAPFFTYRTYLATVRQSLGQIPGGLQVVRGERSFYMGDARPWRASQQVVDELSLLAKPGERLIVGPVDLRQTIYSDVVFYHLFPELTPATYFIEMDPGLANAEGSRLAADVASSDWLILTRFWSGWIEPNDSIVFGSDVPNQVVESDFCLVNSFENDLVRLLHRCAGGGAPGPYDAPYDPRYDYAVEVRVPVPPRPDGTCTPTCNGTAAPGAFGPPPTP